LRVGVREKRGGVGERGRLGKVIGRKSPIFPSAIFLPEVRAAKGGIIGAVGKGRAQ